MLSNEEVLAALTSHNSPQSLAPALARMLRVPDAWSRLHDPQFLQRAAAKKDPFSLSSLAEVELEIAHLASADLPPALKQEQEEAWDAAVRGQQLPQTFRTGAILATAMVRAEPATAPPQGFTAVARRAPQLWRSALACAYSGLASPDRWIADLLAPREAALTQLAIDVLLANLPAHIAAERLAAADPNALLDIIEFAGCERPLIRALMDRQDPLPSTGPHSPRDVSLVSSSLEVACKEWFTSTHDLAEQAFSHAWDDASSLCARVMDLFAEFAQEKGDPALALEARREAVRVRPSRTRQANLVLALIAAGRPDEAIALPIPEDPTPQERIARALAHSSAGMRTIAQENARELREWFVAAGSVDLFWTNHLASLYCACGMRGYEAERRISLADARPHDAGAQLSCATALLEVGDAPSATDYAVVAMALEPTSLNTRKILARSLQSGGRPKDAIPHWRELAISDPGMQDHVAECAIEAEMWDVAFDAAEGSEPDASETSAKRIAVRSRALAHQGDHEQARSLLDTALQRDPYSADLWLAHAECQSLNGDSQAAGLTLATAAQATPESSRIHLAYARWLAEQGRASEAAAAAQRSVALDPSDRDARYDLASRLTALGRNDEARQQLQTLLETYPRWWEARQAYAMALLASGDMDTAASIVDSVPLTARPQAHFFAGSLQIQAGLASGDAARLERGRTLLYTAHTRGFASPELYAYLARAHEKTSSWDAVQEAYARCLELAPEHETVLREEATLGIARAALARDIVPQAISILKLARPRYPHSAALHILLGRSHLRANQPTEAIVDAETASHLDPSSLEALQVLSEAAEMAGDLPLACEAIRRQLGLSPHHVDTWLRLARASLRAEDHFEARSALAHALQLGRRQTEVLRHAAELLADMGSRESAQRTLKAAAATSPTEPTSLADLGRLAERLEVHGVAEWAWTRLAQAQPANFDALYRAGASLWSQSKAAEALAYWRQAYALDSSNAALLIGLARASLAEGDTGSALTHYVEATSAAPDPQLNVEAGRAIMTHGTPRDALEILARSVALAPNQWEPLAALGECLLRLNRPADAARALQRACLLEAPAGVFAMLAIAHLEAGSPAEAMIALDRSLAMVPQDAVNAIWVSQAAAKLGRWKAAIDVLTSSAHIEPSMELLGAALSLRLRIGDGQWLHDAADARMDTPFPALSKDAPISPGDTNSLRQPQLGRLFELRHRALQEALPEAELEEWRQLEHVDSTGESREALAAALLRSDAPEQALRVLYAPSEKRYRPWTDLLAGIALERLRRFHEAYLAFQPAGSDPALGSLAQYLMGRSLFAEDDLVNAAAHMNTAVAAMPDQPRWHYRLALAYHKAGKADAAVPHFQRAAELEAGNPLFLLALARALQETGHASDAFQAYERALPAFSSDAQVITETAEAGLAAHEIRRAATHFARALDLTPDSPRALLGAARTAIAARRLRQARQYADRALHISPQDADVLTVLGEILAHEGDVDQALKAYKRALRLADHPVPLFVARSALLIRADRALKAVEELLEATRLFPTADTLWMALADAYEASNQPENALSAAEKALALSPGDSRAHLLVGRAARKLGQLDRALAELKAASERTGHTPDAMLELGILLEARRDNQGALDAYKRAIDIDKRCTEAYVRAGLVLKGNKSYSAAADMFHHASALDPLDPNILHQLAAVRALELVHGGNLPTMVSP